MTATDCKRWLPLLSPYIDGELPSAGRLDVERHLSGCQQCAARVNDLRATSGLIRVGMEMLADEADFSGFAEKVFAKIGPERLPLWERWWLSLNELFTYHRAAMVSSLVTAAIALLVAVPLVLQSRPPIGYASPQLAVRRVSTVPEAHVAPVVMQGDRGNTIVWLVNHRHVLEEQTGPTGKAEELDSQPEPIQKQPLKQDRPRGGEL